MESTPTLYDTLFSIFGQYQHWLDIRHLHTLLWIIVGLIKSKTVSLPEWAPFVRSRAQYAQSIVRRFSRWLNNDRVRANHLWGPIIQAVLQEWTHQTLYLALDTTVLWNRFCHIRLSILYRGRAIPLVWKTIEHSSSAVGLETYQDLLATASRLLPEEADVVFLADRGFADTHLMRYLHDKLHWHYRIRIKSSFYVYRPGQRRVKVGRMTPARGQAWFQQVYLTKQRYGPVYLAVGRPLSNGETWYIISDQPTNRRTFDEYSLRFDIEENFLDDKSGGFQLESSLFRSAEALSRLVLALAAATLFLVSQGVEVVASGKRRFVDAHWFRGHSYLKIGWKWVLRSAVAKYELIAQLRLPPVPDPEPAKASRKQACRRRRKRFFSEKSFLPA